MLALNIVPEIRVGYIRQIIKSILVPVEILAIRIRLSGNLLFVPADEQPASRETDDDESAV